MQTPQAIQWPEVAVGGRRFVLRFAYSAHYQLTRWGKTLADATAIEIAAACAGTFVNGVWRSEGFERALDLADMADPGDEAGIIAGVTDALKKAYPEATMTTLAVPGTDEATKTNSSTSGPLPPATPASV